MRFLEERRLKSPPIPVTPWQPALGAVSGLRMVSGSPEIPSVRAKMGQGRNFLDIFCRNTVCASVSPMSCTVPCGWHRAGYSLQRPRIATVTRAGCLGLGPGTRKTTKTITGTLATWQLTTVEGRPAISDQPGSKGRRGRVTAGPGTGCQSGSGGNSSLCYPRIVPSRRLGGTGGGGLLPRGYRAFSGGGLLRVQGSRRAAGSKQEGQPWG